MKTLFHAVRLCVLMTLCCGLLASAQAEEQKKEQQQDTKPAEAKKPASVQEIVATLMNQVRNKGEVDHRPVFAVPPALALAEFQKYLNDPNEDVHVTALYTIRGIAKGHKEPNVQRKAIEIIFDIAENGDMDDQATAAGMLLQFSSVYFTPHMKDVIASLVNRERPDEDAIVLAGTAQVQSLRERLRQLSASGNWKAALSLARLGDEVALQQVIAKFNSQPTIDKRVDLLNELAFTRQPQAVAIIASYLFTDERAPKAGDFVGAPYAEKALYFLKVALADFPKKGEKIVVDALNRTLTRKVSDAEEIKAAREWLREQDITRLRMKK